MPRGDGTGPMGMGPMTGRGAGYCAGFGIPGFMNPTPRFGMGRGYGRGRVGGGMDFARGRGYGRGFGRFAYGYPAWMPQSIEFLGRDAPSAETEMQIIENRAKALTEELEFLKKRLEEIKSTTTIAD